MSDTIGDRSRHQKEKMTVIDDVTRVSILFVSQVKRSLYSQCERIYFISRMSVCSKPFVLVRMVRWVISVNVVAEEKEQ